MSIISKVVHCPITAVLILDDDNIVFSRGPYITLSSLPPHSQLQIRKHKSLKVRCG